MGCQGFWGCLLKLLNFLMTLVGLAMVGYGIYLFVMYKQASPDSGPPPVSPDEPLIQLGRPLIMSVSLLSNNVFDNLPKAWFIYLFIGVGAVLFVISCFGCIGASTKNGCCLSTYAVFIILLILLELGCAAFIFFDKDWDHKIPADKTGTFDMINDFLEDHWSIAKWVILGVVVLEAALFLLTVIVRSINRPADYDSDEEFINPRQTVKQPLINRPPPATGVPVTGSADQRPGRNDAWSARMREKYGLDTSEFTYNPSESGRYQQSAGQAPSEGGRCTIM
ncbi:tobamovirus multiplication protein 2A-like [Chenopodium quinoa]|uniref:tobamovirus multiplication protein 2A-like n=1 Tax=Chenopodium quinoa TaxID=63459 RepID=UPI000B78A6E4|nr:tobamovirus multiplication protein 2A-like [Chenopodium quinoa]XP_021768129.1 tobamovirus multiplication protein 2A-like [Chenopodium quinoa]